MKNRLLLFFLFFSIFTFSQKVIKGTVYQANGTLEGAAVYVNNTMLGTTTNENGEFSIPIKEGQYELIISYLGFKKIVYTLNTKTYSKPLVFALVEDENMLDEIIIKKTIYDDEWNYNLQAFKEEFIGITELSAGCEILNPKVLHFEFDGANNIFTAFARAPLQIKHKDLGYLITYELENFTRKGNYVSYLGFTRYQELKGGKRKQKKWQENRLKAYHGSVVHFLKSLLKNTFKEDGFIVHQFKRVENPERPTENEIKKARELIRLNGVGMVFSSDEITNPKNAVDSAMVVLKKVRLPKTKDYLYKSNLLKEDLITLKNNDFYFSFDDHLSIVYTKEKEELRYITRNAFSKKREPLPQTSSILQLIKNSKIDKSGVLENPLNVVYEGYWSYEKFGDSLPLDYVPEK